MLSTIANIGNSLTYDCQNTLFEDTCDGIPFAVECFKFHFHWSESAAAPVTLERHQPTLAVLPLGKEQCPHVYHFSNPKFFERTRGNHVENPVDCGVPSLPNNTALVGNCVSTFPNSCQYQCESGYNPDSVKHKVTWEYSGSILDGQTDTMLRLQNAKINNPKIYT